MKYEGDFLQAADQRDAAIGGGGAALCKKDSRKIFSSILLTWL